MRHFSYFLFENFDADAHAHDPLNPRRFLNADTDAVLSCIAGHPAGTCNYKYCEAAFGKDVMHTLITGGILKKEKDYILFDTPIFLREDAVELRFKTAEIASKLTDELEKHIPELQSICADIRNGFPVELNLYHILCGMVFDGTFFHYLEQRNAVATSRLHPSGFDYLSVIYEKCPELDSFSDGLLCSYNRFVNSQCALQSFGDANGDRHDFYRFFRLLESGNIPQNFTAALSLFNAHDPISKNEILRNVSNLITHGTCSTHILALLEHFSYTKDGVISVPVYTAAERETINKNSRAVEESIGEQFVTALTELSEQIKITSNFHHIASGEIANELYHILFGSINEELVRRGIVAEPPYIPGEGRYLKCIQLQ